MSSNHSFESFHLFSFLSVGYTTNRYKKHLAAKDVSTKTETEKKAIFGVATLINNVDVSDNASDNEKDSVKKEVKKHKKKKHKKNDD